MPAPLYESPGENMPVSSKHSDRSIKSPVQKFQTNKTQRKTWLQQSCSVALRPHTDKKRLAELKPTTGRINICIEAIRGYVMVYRYKNIFCYKECTIKVPVSYKREFMFSVCKWSDRQHSHTMTFFPHRRRCSLDSCGSWMSCSMLPVHFAR